MFDSKKSNALLCVIPFHNMNINLKAHRCHLLKWKLFIVKLLEMFFCYRECSLKPQHCTFDTNLFIISDCWGQETDRFPQQVTPHILYPLCSYHLWLFQRIIVWESYLCGIFVNLWTLWGVQLEYKHTDVLKVRKSQHWAPGEARRERGKGRGREKE